MNNILLTCIEIAQNKGILFNESDLDKAKEYVDAYNKKVPLYHRIRKVHFVDRPFEKTSSGKIKRK